MKNILAIETSSPVLSVALKRGTGRIREEVIPGFLNHAENLMPAIHRLLEKERLSVNNIDTYLIGRGPGSFTGLRIGFATLKGLAAPTKTKCFGFLSLDTIACGIRLPDRTRLGVCRDAYRQKIYSRFYKRRGGTWVPEGRIAVSSFDQLCESFEAENYVAGDALNRYHDSFQELAENANLRFLPEDFWYPRAATMISCFADPSRRGRHTARRQWLRKLEKPKDFVPLYFRLSEAEEKRKDHVRYH